jgi:PAS domain-containing protein
MAIELGTSDAVHPEDLPRVLELLKRAMGSGIPFQFDQRLRRFDGEYRWFNNHGVPIRDDSGLPSVGELPQIISAISFSVRCLNSTGPPPFCPIT